MSPPRAALVLTVAAAALTAPRPGVAQEGTAPTPAPHATPRPARSRLLLGLALSDLFAVSGERAGGFGPAGANNGGLFVAYERRLLDGLSVQATVGRFSWSSQTSSDLDYDRLRTDIGLAPHLSWPWAPRRLTGAASLELYLAAPVGVSLARVTPPARRAFTERIDERPGWYAGLGVGATLVGRRWGVFSELAYLRHASAVDVTLTPIAPLAPPVKQSLRSVDHAVQLSFGALFAF